MRTAPSLLKSHPHILQIHVYPVDSEKGKAIIAKTHTKAPKEGVPSRAERRKAMYTPRSAARLQKLSVATVAAPVRP